MKKINEQAENISPALMGFAKVLDVQNVRSTKNCVIYTRVSSKEQAENNTSLTSQKMYCEEYCKKNGYAIKAYLAALSNLRKEMNERNLKRCWNM